MRILIVGATSDIGYETLKLLRTEHEIIATGYSNTNRIKQIADLIGKNNVINIDASNLKEVLAKLSNIEVECMIHFPSKAYYGLIQDMTIDSWNEIVNLNFSSVFATTKAIIPKMIRNGGGKLLFISSIWGRVGASYEVVYSATKGGVDAFVRALAKEVAPSNIAVNSISLGMVDTKMNDHLSEDDIESISMEIPFSRPASALECAIFIKKIIEMPNYATGQNIRFDGAWY